MQRPARLRGDAGAAVVDFAMMSVLLVLLLFAVLQVAVYAYERNIVAASASDAARYAANAGASPADGGRRASDLIAKGLTSADARLVPCTGTSAVDRRSGLSIVRVHCSGRMRLLLLPFPVPLGIDVTGSALQEHAR